MPELSRLMTENKRCLPTVHNVRYLQTMAWMMTVSSRHRMEMAQPTAEMMDNARIWPGGWK